MYILFSFKFLIPGGCFFGHLTSFYCDLSSLQPTDSLFIFKLPARTGNHTYQEGFLFLSAFVIAASPTKKDSKTYFPEQAGSGTRYHSPEDILCSTLGHKSQSPEDICINEEHLDNLRGTSNITQPAENFWPAGAERWSRPWPTGITASAPAEENGIWLNTARAAKAEKPPKIVKKSIKTPETTVPTLVPATISQTN